MLTLLSRGVQLCDGVTRRDILQAGSLGLFGLSLPDFLHARETGGASQRSVTPPRSRARSCILLFLMGGPPQHSTWDPKPDAPAEIRGEFSPMATRVPGMQFSELLPRTACLADKLCVLRAVSSNDNAHSSSGYYMLTGHPHQPMNFENANPGPPNDAPSLGAVIRRLHERHGTTGLPAAVRLPHRIFNTDGSVWPGQDAGYLGRGADPWLFTCQPAAPDFHAPDLMLPVEVSPARLEKRCSLLEQINRRLDEADRDDARRMFDRQWQQAFDLVRSPQARRAFCLDQEPAQVRDRYGWSQFGQSCLLARRLVEVGICLVQVNWYRGPDEPADNPCWDSHTNEAERLRNVLVPPMDQAYSALLEDLDQRGLLGETLVVCTAEFGRSPRINNRAGRDHWGYVYSTVLAGGGVRGGQVLGSSDRVGAYPREGRVQPEDLTATIFQALGHKPDTEIRDPVGRPLPISRGEVIWQVF
jgi:Protein of unknown function (DUF1501)